MEGFAYLSVLVFVILATYIVVEMAVPHFMARYHKVQTKRTGEMTERLEDSFIFWERKKMLLIYFSPFIFGGLLFLLTRHIIGAGIGFVFGFIVPQIMVGMARQRRIKKISGQLVDSLMILSSSLKAGLSFLQAIEVVCEEMPVPISQEFHLILSENKLGVSFEDSLKKFRRRVPIDEVNLIVSSILIARESGGELPRVLMRLANTIRDNLKLKEKIATLTLQGKLQGIIMMILPIGFAYFIYKSNPGHFDVMLQTADGKKLLALAIILQLVGMVMIKKFSTMRN